MADMQIIYGKCRLIGRNKTINVSSSDSYNHNNSTTTSETYVNVSYGVKLEIDKHFVEIKLDRDIFIEDGDTVSTCGILNSDGIVQCNCYENYTKNVRGYSNVWKEIFTIIFGIIFCTGGIAWIFAIWPAADFNMGDLMAIPFFVAGAGISIYGFNTKSKMEEAHSKLRAFRPPALSG